MNAGASTVAASTVVRALLAGIPIDPDALNKNLGPHDATIRALAAMAATHPMNAASYWDYLKSQDPSLMQYEQDPDAPLAGALSEIEQILDPEHKRRPLRIPSPENAQSLEDLSSFVNSVLEYQRGAYIKNRPKNRAVSYAVTRLLLKQGRVLYDPTIGDLGGTPYLIDERGAVWPLAADVPQIRAMLSVAGLNPTEAAFSWVLAELQALAHSDGIRTELSRFIERRGYVLYLSSGPWEVVRVSADDGGDATFDLVPNGTDDVFFAADSVLPAWNPVAPEVSPFTLAAFNPALTAPGELPAYSVIVQQQLLTAYLVGLLAGIRPLPLLAAIGDKGGGKTTVIRGISQLTTQTDPTTPSPDPRDFWALAVHSLLMAFDNIDSPPDWFPDVVAALVTGVDYRRRKFYTDSTVETQKPRAALALSTRTARFARPDVAERTLPLYTEPFTNGRRKSDKHMTDQVRENRDGVLVWLATKAAQLLRQQTRAPGDLPGRFVDFGRVVWGLEGRTAYDTLKALEQAQALCVGDADELLAAIIAHIDTLIVLAPPLNQWEGTPSALIQALKNAGADLPYQNGGRAIAQKLREGGNTLAVFGVDVDIKRSGNNTVFSLTKL